MQIRFSIVDEDPESWYSVGPPGLGARLPTFLFIARQTTDTSLSCQEYAFKK